MNSIKNNTNGDIKKIIYRDKYKGIRYKYKTLYIRDIRGKIISSW